MSLITRRGVLAGLAGSAVVGTALAQSPLIRVTKDPNSGCCDGWVAHLRAAGFATIVTESRDLTALKTRFGVPHSLFACHTAELVSYVIEGHVPAKAIRRLLAEQPEAKGLAVPGMPVGSPGMEVPGSPHEEYEVVLFGSFGERVFARFKGTEELPVRG